MTLSELFAVLSYGELSNLAIGVEGTGAIEEQHQPKITNYINEVLLRLYSRFVILEKDVLIETRNHITNYHLTTRFAESNWVPEEAGYPYIKDLLIEPFTGDVIRILSVFDSYGRELSLNDNENPRSLFTPQKNVLQVPHPVHLASLSVGYQARHPKLDPDDLSAEIHVPDVLLAALTAYVGYNVYTHMNTQESTAKAQEHYSKYEAICLEAEQLDLVSTSQSSTNTRFQKAGWK